VGASDGASPACAASEPESCDASAPESRDASEPASDDEELLSVVDEVKDVVRALVVPTVLIEECDDAEVVEFEWALVVEVLPDGGFVLSLPQPCVATPRRATKNRPFMMGLLPSARRATLLRRDSRDPGLRSPAPSSETENLSKLFGVEETNDLNGALTRSGSF
jgi:hypothetical protein